MKKRKLIGVIISEADTLYPTDLINGIQSQAYALDMDVAVFSTFTKNIGSEQSQYGEMNIYNLINYDLLDGIVFVPTSFCDQMPTRSIKAEILARSDIPSIAVDTDDPDFDCICMDDEFAFEQVVNHFIDVHKFTDIICLSGFKGNTQAENRIQGYRNALKNHNIPIKEENIIYGDYWKPSAIELAEKIINGTIKAPQAVVCGNDVMAITLCNTLIENGIRVPEDIAISGYDAIQESVINVPSITSYTAPTIQTGINAVIKLYKKMTGKTVEPCRRDNGNLEIAYSCGCGENYDYVRRHRLDTSVTSTYHEDLFKNNYMTESINMSRNLEDCMHHIGSYIYLIKDLYDYYLCLNDEPTIENPEYVQDDTEETVYRKEGYSDNMYTLIAYRSGIYSEESKYDFKSKIMHPALFEERDYPTTFFFSPLHFNDRCFGYAVMNYGKKITVYDHIYRDWTRNITNALELVRVRERLVAFNRSLYIAYTRDSLTGVYNRHGLEKMVPSIIKKAINENKKLLFVIADINKLKLINDTYGHIEGDNAIKVFAEACDSVKLFDEKVIRIGGDEFVAIGYGDYKDSAIYEYADKVNKLLNQYNTASGKPYEVCGSFGAVCNYVNKLADSQKENEIIDKLISTADKLMYHQKLDRRRIARENAENPQ